MNQDWIELLESLNANQVKFVIVGAFALAHHGFPRYTGDLDIFVEGTQENSEKLYVALAQFGAPTGELNSDFLVEPGITLTFGLPPRRVDILNWISGVTWEDAWQDVESGQLGGIPVPILSARALKKNKLASGRPQDLVDIEKFKP